MTDKPINSLRQRMIEDMTARHFAEKAQKDYIRYVKNFAAFLGRSPDTTSAEDIRLFQLDVQSIGQIPLHSFATNGSYRPSRAVRANRGAIVDGR